MTEFKPPAKELQDESHRAAMRQSAARLIAQLDPGISRRRAAEAAHLHRSTGERLYAADADLIADLVDEHLWELGKRLDGDPRLDPRSRLEGVIASWLGFVAEHSDAHCVFLLAVHQLPEHHRASAQGRSQAALESVRLALCEAVPSASALPPEAMAALMATARALLSDVPFPFPPWTRDIPAHARRVTGMLLAAAEAAAAGTWPALGPAAGPTGERAIAEAAVARRCLSTLLNVAAAGGEVTLTRRGRRVARLVGVA